jgi:hypothetical protein
MTKEQQREIDNLIREIPLKDLPNMTVREHHMLSIGVLSGCYPYVPHELQMAIEQALEAIKEMGLPIDFEDMTRATISNS